MTLRELQLYRYGIMKDIVSVCDKHGIQYILHYGTLLGAIRHGGYIPWDDDIDIAVPWGDYKKLLNLINQEYPEKYFVQNIWTDHNFPLLWTQVRVNGTTNMPVEYYAYDIHWGMCIDIFVLAAAEKDERKKLQMDKAIARADSLLAKEFMTMVNMKARGRRQKLINMIPKRIRYLMVNAILNRYVRDPEADGLVCTLPVTKNVYAYSDVMVTEKHVFEDGMYSVPKGYDAVLTTEYGDYMTFPPEEDRVGHEKALGMIINDVTKDYREYKAELKRFCDGGKDIMQWIKNRAKEEQSQEQIL